MDYKAQNLNGTSLSDISDGFNWRYDFGFGVLLALDDACFKALKLKIIIS